MSESRSFTLIGNFTDNITSKINDINRSLDGMRRTMQSFGNKNTGFNSITTSIGKVVSAYKHLSAEQRTLRSEIGQTNNEMRQQSVLLNRISRSMRSHNTQAGRMAAQGGGAQMWRDAHQAAHAYDQTLRRMRSRGGGPPMGPPGGGPPMGPYGPPPGRRSHMAGHVVPERQQRGERGGRGGILGEVVSAGIITNAIVGGFYQGVQLFQNAVGTIFGAFAERTKDQLEDIASAGGIFSASKFGGAKGLPATFQGALEMQDDINKSMAAIASALPGTTQDYVMNARRMTDTLGQVMTKDTKAFEKLAADLSGQIGIQGAKAFEVVNIETAKATTMLEKLNPTHTTVPMSQIVEDMMKSDKVTTKGLRRYVSFRRATTFEAALDRNLKDLNKAGAGTADRLRAILKVLKEAVPPELITAMTTSVSGVIEGFKSAVLDPDVGIFGLSRSLGMQVAKFDRETGKPMLDKFGRQIMETTNFFKMFSEIFGNIGNLINSSILPGITSLYNPFELLAQGLTKIRDYSYEIFRRQQGYTAYYSNLAEKYKMSAGLFKSGEKGGVEVIMDILEGFNMMTKAQHAKFTAIMNRKVSANQIEIDMKQIYKTIIPAIMDSPLFTQIGMVIGDILARFLTSIADTIDGLLHRNLPSTSAFAKAFADGGGLDALNRIIMYLAEIMGKIILEMGKIVGTMLLRSVMSGNLALAGLMAAPLLLIPGVRQGLRGIPKALGGKAGAISEAAQGGKLDASLLNEGAGVVRRVEGIRNPAFRAIPSERIVNPNFPQVALGVKPGIGGLNKGYTELPSIPKPIKPGSLSPAKSLNPALDSIEEIVRESKKPAIAPVTPKPSLAARMGGRYSRFMEGTRGRLLSSKTFGPIAEATGLQNLLKAGPGLKALKNPMKLLKGSGSLGPLAIGTSIITAITALLSGDSLASALGQGAGPLIGSAVGFAIAGPLGAFIGGWVGSMDQITAPLTEIFNSLFGAVEGLFNVFKVVVEMVGDLISALVGLIGGIFGVQGQFDGIRIILAPFTLLFQVLEVGLKGLALAFAQVRLWLTNWAGSPEAKKAAQVEFDSLNLDLKQSQGRINAYNAAMLPLVEMEKQRAQAWKELQGGKADAARTGELRSFIEEIDKEIAKKRTSTTKKTSPVTTVKPPPGLTASERKYYELRTGLPKPAPAAAPVRTSVPKPAAPPAAPFDFVKFSRDAAQNVGLGIYSIGQSIKESSVQFNRQWVVFKSAITSWPYYIQQATLEAGVQMNRQWVIFKSAITSWPYHIQQALLSARISLHRSFVSFKSWFDSIGPSFKNAIDSSLSAMSSAWPRMVSYLGNLGSNIVEGFKQGLTGHQTSPPGEGTGRPGYITIGGKRYWRGTDGSLTALALGSGSPFTGSFGEALGFEMSHKPPGSSIVIANSSETIIPAAGGFGMKAMANTLGWIQNGVNMLMRANSDAINKLQMPADTTDVNIPGRPRIGIAKGMRGPGATMVIEGLLGEAVDTGVSALFDSIKNARDRKLAASQKGSVASRYMGGLGDAISSELKNKPPGSRLAIANTSETIIPAAGGADGAGMANFVNYMSSMSRNTAVSNMVLDNIRNLTGLLINTISPISTKIDGIRSVMTSGAMRVKFMIGGTGGQGGPGAVDAFNPIASSYGLGITSGYRPGDPGYHGLNRARDYSNSTGPTSQMMAFATFMAASFGSDLAELIYTPLGFGIKNGQMVGLDYWGPRVNGMHYNHVHVAYANGPGNPAFFSSASQAAAWEEKMAPKYATVKTVTANSSEGFGGGHTLNAPITIHQQPGQDADELASLVLMRLSMAVDELTNHS